MPYPFDWSPPGSRPRGLSWTPPLSSSNRIAMTDTSALWDEAEALRGMANVKPKGARSDTYKPPENDEQKIRAWAPDVVVSLVHNEVMSLLRFVPGAKDADPASLLAVDASGAAKLVCRLTPPADVPFIEKDRRGLPSVVHADQKGKRRASRNAILAHASDLDLLYMECLSLGIKENRHVYLLMLATLSLLHSSGQLFKHRFSVPRPHLLSQEVQPTIEVPGHASFPAGHSAQAHGVSNLIGSLLGLAPTPSNKNLCDRLIEVADHVAEMRVVAGLHYDFDNLAGRALGQAMASLLTALGDRKTTGWQPYAYAATLGAPVKEPAVSATLPATPVLAALWALAAGELKDANID